MKKTSKLFGAVALSAALALGTAIPAFAIDTTSIGVNKSGDFVTGETDTTGTTNVRLAALDAEQIIATLPVDITIAAPAAGGDIIAPSPDKYAITNGGVSPIKVTGMKAAPAANWEYSDEVLEDLVSNNNPARTKSTHLTVQSDLSKTYDLTAAGITETDDFSADIANFTADANGGKIEIQLGGQAFPTQAKGSASAPGAKTEFSPENSESAVQVIYTVAAAE